MADVRYKSFHEMYKIISFALCVGMSYPNRATEKTRLIGISLILLSVTPVTIIICMDMHRYWSLGDFNNLIRHFTITSPFLFGFMKMVIMFYKRVEVKELIDEFNRDYASYNNFHDKYKTIINSGIRNSQIYSEKCWCVNIVMCIMIFPIMAVVLNTYNYTFKFEATKYMIHDVNKPFAEPEERFESPFYEIIFFYMMYCMMYYFISFIGYDGFFGLCINHACLKIELIWKSLEEAMKTDNPYRDIVEVIKEHQRVFRFIDIMQDKFSLWLGAVYLWTITQVCTCMYHIVEGGEFDIKYMIFIVATVVQIYLPCHYVSKLKAMSVETADVIYCSGWENVNDIKVKKMLMFMIARAQILIEIKGYKIITFDMNLFVKIMQATYSMYTLLRS